MKIQTGIVVIGLTALLSGCQGMDNNALLQSGVQTFQAYTLNDAQVKRPIDPRSSCLSCRDYSSSGPCGYMRSIRCGSSSASLPEAPLTSVPSFCASDCSDASPKA
ncbi:Metalloprotease LoiP precursor|nr:Metalloprotease LoiP precursor [Candidatus Pantoea persica]